MCCTYLAIFKRCAFFFITVLILFIWNLYYFIVCFSKGSQNFTMNKVLIFFLNIHYFRFVEDALLLAPWGWHEKWVVWLGGIGKINVMRRKIPPPFLLEIGIEPAILIQTFSCANTYQIHTKTWNFDVRTLIRHISSNYFQYYFWKKYRVNLVYSCNFYL